MDRYKSYKSIDTIPIFNLTKYFETNNLRYLLKIDIDSIDSIELTDDEKHELFDISTGIMKEFPNVDMTIQLLWANTLVAYSDLICEKDKLQNFNNHFQKYINYLDANYKNFVFGDMIFDKASELNNYLKQIADYDDLQSLRIELFDYNHFKAIPRSKQNILHEIISLRDITNQNIDIYKTSFKEYLEIRKYANEKLKKLADGK